MSVFSEQLVNATRRHGFNPVVGDIPLWQQTWFSWYRGNVNDFHTYQRNVMGTKKKFYRLTLNMPKKVCEDWTTLIWNDACEVRVEGDEQAQTVLDNVLYDNDHEIEMARLIETTFGMGMGYIVPYKDNGTTKVDYIDFQHGLVLEWENKTPTAILTIARTAWKNDKGEDFHLTHLTYHIHRHGQYKVVHEAYISNNRDVLGQKDQRYLKVIFDDATVEAMKKNIRDEKGQFVDVEYSVSYSTPRPFFGVVFPNVANHWDTANPNGVSVFSGALDLFRAIDTVFDVMTNEAWDARTRIFIAAELIKHKEIINEATHDTEIVSYFDELERAYQGIHYKDDAEREALKFVQGEYRFEQLDMLLKRLIQIAGMKCGLGKNYYSVEDGDVYQNVENVISSKSDTFKTKKKHEIIIGRAIENVCRGILWLEKEEGRYSGDPENLEITVQFDDSIVEDDKAISARWLELAAQGYVSKWRALMEVLGVTEEDAKQMVAERNDEDVAVNKAYMADFEGVDDDTESDED